MKLTFQKVAYVTGCTQAFLDYLINNFNYWAENNGNICIAIDTLEEQEENQTEELKSILKKIKCNCDIIFSN